MSETAPQVGIPTMSTVVGAQSAIEDTLKNAALLSSSEGLELRIRIDMGRGDCFGKRAGPRRRVRTHGRKGGVFARGVWEYPSNISFKEFKDALLLESSRFSSPARAVSLAPGEPLAWPHSTPLVFPSFGLAPDPVAPDFSDEEAPARSTNVMFETWVSNDFVSVTRTLRVNTPWDLDARGLSSVTLTLLFLQPSRTNFPIEFELFAECQDIPSTATGGQKYEPFIPEPFIPESLLFGSCGGCCSID